MIASEAEFVKMNLEFDETGQHTRLRRGLIEVQGVMPVLVPSQKNANCKHSKAVNRHRVILLASSDFFSGMYSCSQTFKVQRMELFSLCSGGARAGKNRFRHLAPTSLSQ